MYIYIYNIIKTYQHENIKYYLLLIHYVLQIKHLGKWENKIIHYNVVK